MTDEKTTVLIPVQLTVLVPVDIAVAVDTAGAAMHAGAAVVDPIEADNGADMVAAACTEANLSEAVQDAMDALLASVQYLRRTHPEIKARLTPFAGVIEEIEV